MPQILITDSLEAARNDLASKDVVDDKDMQINQGRTGPRYFFIKDPDGILVEITEDGREFAA